MTKKEESFGRSVLGKGSSFNQRFISDYERLADVSNYLKGIGFRIVLTQGSYDLLHIGHARYFEEAKKHGDMLFVGVDSDEKILARKGPGRPIVPQEERLEMIVHTRYVDAVILKNLKDPKWNLIKTVRPDVLVVTKETYTKAQIKELEKFCGEIVVLERMATASTSAKIRKMQINTAQSLGQALTPKLIKTIEDTLAELKAKQ